ncbi:hypothetical protein [Plantactinospora endophytica]|uniref:Uncharacterized protein n=1 Tax=Plantactinospora endophytica TaxID=673535 RepID=A0ABQ4E5F0_9ACTN|nr:hypothetical protein [Plantactinospora endophytica]GIG89938.1 hypothetical protein Pen02_48740 [Plantactinospora endophytica]
MRKRLRNSLVAAGLAVAVTVTAVPAAAPAQAAPRTEGMQVMAFDWVSLVVTVAGHLLSGGGSDDSALRAAVQEIVAAVESAKNDIIAHTDAIAAADVQACARQHTIEFSDIENMSNTVRQIWAQNATACATLATAYVNTVQTPQAVDNIGHVLPSLFAIVIAARGRANLPNGINLIIQDQIRSYEAVVAKLTPTNCVKKGNKEPGSPREKWWECTAYNGDWGQSGWVTAPAEPVRAEAEYAATRNTSRPAALSGLPRLRALGV